MGNSPKQKATNKSSNLEKKQLSSLRWQSNNYDEFRELITPSFTQNIGYLSLNEGKLGIKGVRILGQAQWPNLKNLMLNENRLQDKGMAFLVKCQMPNLVHLNLMGNFLRDTSCKIMTKGNWPLIQTITFNDYNQKRINSITKRGITQLKMIKHGCLKCKITYGQSYPYRSLQEIQIWKYL